MRTLELLHGRGARFEDADEHNEPPLLEAVRPPSLGSPRRTSGPATRPPRR